MREDNPEINHFLSQNPILFSFSLKHNLLAKIVFKMWWLALFFILLPFPSDSQASFLASEVTCPSDCICFSDYLNNLASWRWIENEYEAESRGTTIEIPFTEHNEVYDMFHFEGKGHRLQGEVMQTATCILRNSSQAYLTNLFEGLNFQTKILSLLQAPGSGNITLERKEFEHLPSLIGLDISGTEEPGNSISITSDSFNSISLTFLSLNKVILPSQLIENTLESSFKSRARGKRTQTPPEHSQFEIGNEISLLPPISSEPDHDPFNLTLLDSSSSEILPYESFKKELKEIGKTPKVSVAFTNSRSLVYLRLSDCNMEDITWDMFYNLGSLKYLHLEKNSLLFLPDFLFYATPNLTTLSLSNNRILSLETVGLAGLLNLRKLDITKNNISHLSELSLPPFPHLEFADFSHNPIESLFPNTFEVMNYTKTLLLGSPGTFLEFFPNSFFGLTSLTKLTAINVKVLNLERQMLSGMPGLKFLTFQGLIDRISFDAFGEVPKLERLTLRNCSLRKLSMDSFYGLNSLLELDLSHNKLSLIPPGLFDDQISLREIYLNNNLIRTLNGDIFNRVPAKIIRLDSNPWHCSCEISNWNHNSVNRIKKYYQRRNETFCSHRHLDKGSMCDKDQFQIEIKYVYEKRVSPKCESPNKFRGENVFAVFRKELVCAKKMSIFPKKNKLIQIQMKKDVEGKEKVEVEVERTKNNVIVKEGNESKIQAPQMDLESSSTTTTTTTTSIPLNISKEPKNLSIELLEETEKKLKGQSVGSTHPGMDIFKKKSKLKSSFPPTSLPKSNYISSNELMNYLNSKPLKHLPFNLHKNKQRNNQIISKKELLRAQLAKLQRMNQNG